MSINARTRLLLLASITALAILVSAGPALAATPAVSAGDYHTVGLKSDGTVVATGSDDLGQCDVSAWTNIVAVSAGHYHTVGLKADGSVVATGYNGDGECDVSGWTGIVAVSAGQWTTVGVKADGTVVATGDLSGGQSDVSGWSHIVAVAAGDAHIVGLKSDGTVIAAGLDEYGQCSVVSTWAAIVAVAADRDHSVGLKSDGTVVHNPVGALGNYWFVGDGNSFGWTNVAGISARGQHLVGLRSDGTAVAVGDSSYGMDDVSGWTNVIGVAAGSWTTVGLKADGSVVATGRNDVGQCDVSGWHLGVTPTGSVPAGSNVHVVDSATHVSVTFGTVTSPGVLTVTPTPAGQQAPGSFQLVGGSCYDVSTTAGFSGNTLVTLPYDPASISGEPSSLRLFHWKNNGWQDVTVSVDAANHTITGQTDSLSPFAVFQPLATVNTPASSDWSLALLVLAALGVAAVTRRRATATGD